MFLKGYFDCLNQIMVSACLNDNIFLLNLIRKRPLPQAFKTKLLAMTELEFLIGKLSGNNCLLLIVFVY